MDIDDSSTPQYHSFQLIENVPEPAATNKKCQHQYESYKHHASIHPNQPFKPNIINQSIRPLKPIIQNKIKPLRNRDNLTFITFIKVSAFLLVIILLLLIAISIAQITNTVNHNNILVQIILMKMYPQVQCISSTHNQSSSLSISPTRSNEGKTESQNIYSKAKLYSATIRCNEFTLNNSSNNSVKPFRENFVNATERLKLEIYMSYYNGESNDTFVNFDISRLILKFLVNMVHMH